jgi:hypothetical protein
LRNIAPGAVIRTLLEQELKPVDEKTIVIKLCKISVATNYLMHWFIQDQAKRITRLEPKKILDFWKNGVAGNNTPFVERLCLEGIQKHFLHREIILVFLVRFRDVHHVEVKRQSFIDPFHEVS